MTANEALEEFITSFTPVLESSTKNAEERNKLLHSSIEKILHKYNIDKDQSLILAGDPMPACKL